MLHENTRSEYDDATVHIIKWLLTERSMKYTHSYALSHSKQLRHDYGIT